MLKTVYFLDKTVKVVSASRLPPAAEVSALRPRVVTPAYYYNFVEFVSSANCILFRLKKNQVPTANNVQPLVLPHFCTYFLIQTL